ncbi:MAG: TIGR03663 family protein [Archaeoglobaceae archaeon]
MKRIVLILIILGFITRFAFLDMRCMDHDESVHAWIALKNVVENPSYRYDPAFHGPFVYFVISLSFLAFGDSDFSARLPIAVFSILGIYFALRFERWFGNSAFILALFMLFSPSILYYSRYARDDVIVVSSFIAFLYFYFLYRENGRILNALIATVFLAIIFTAKENWVQYFAVFFLAVLIEKYRRKDFRIDRNILICAALFLFISAFLYSSAFAYAIHGQDWVKVMFSRDWIDRFVERSLPYWLSQGVSSPHEKPIYYFMNILLHYEFLPFALAIASITRKRFNFYEVFAILWLFFAFLFYHAMVYKTSWLVVHLATPLAFFAMVFVRNEFFERKETKIAFAFGFVATIIISIHVSYFDYNNVVDQPLIYVQTQNGAVEMAERIKELLAKGHKVAVFAVDGHYWPLPWMLREKNVVFTTQCPQDYDYVFAVHRDYGCLKSYEIVGNYELRKYWEFYEMRKI